MDWNVLTSQLSEAAAGGSDELPAALPERQTG